MSLLFIQRLQLLIIIKKIIALSKNCSTVVKKKVSTKASRNF